MAISRRHSRPSGQSSGDGERAVSGPLTRRPRAHSGAPEITAFAAGFIQIFIKFAAHSH
jgi:hypothetical protein